jgi:nucleoside-diphosphate-sugar epimerase
MVGQKPLILVTGSSGLIGTRLMQDLQRDFRVVGLDVTPNQSGAEEIPCDLTDDTSVREALAQVASQHGRTLASVVHLAAYVDFSGKPSPLYEELTVEGTRRLMRYLHNFETEQFIFSSTLLVMKPAEEDEWLTVQSPTQAEWDYPRSKLWAERVILEERGEVPAVVLRIAGVYDDDCHCLPIAQQISRIHQQQMESYFFPGNRDHGQAFVHLDDLVACIRAAIERRRQLDAHEVFLIGEEDVMSYAELQEEIGRQLHGREWPTYRIPKSVAKAGAWIKEKFAASEDEQPFIKPWMIDLADQHYPISGERARERLGWQPEHTLRGTLPAMIEALERDPQAWYEAHNIPYPGESTEPVAARQQQEQTSERR